MDEANEMVVAPNQSGKQPNRTHKRKSSPQDIDDKSSKYPDTKLWSRSQREAYLEKNIPLIISTVSPIKHISDNALSQEDLFQEAQLAFWNAFDTYDPNRDTLFTTYAHKCMKNAVNEKLRTTTASKRRPKGPVIPYDSDVSEYGDDVVGGDNAEVSEEASASQSPPVEDQVILKDAIELVRKLLNTLFTEQERRIVLALGYEHLTQNEVAKELGCSQAKVSMTYKLARVRLNYELSKNGYADLFK